MHQVGYMLSMTQTVARIQFGVEHIVSPHLAVTEFPGDRLERCREKPALKNQAYYSPNPDLQWPLQNHLLTKNEKQNKQRIHAYHARTDSW